jgi:hypothetical protein
MQVFSGVQKVSVFEQPALDCRRASPQMLKSLPAADLRSGLEIALLKH